MNNLYGGAMSESLPVGGFIWLTEEEKESFKSLELIKSKVSENLDLGYFVEVDIHYPKKSHDEHSDLPFLPIHETPDDSKCRIKKLLCTVKDKVKYILHHDNLIQCLSHGLVLQKVHRVLQFDQKPFLQPYIQLNTIKRAQATDNFQRNLFKLLVNSIYGKSLQNQRRHRDVKLVTKWEGRYGARNYIASHLFKSVSIFEENFVSIELSKSSIMLNKPLYIGASILDISKRMMYSFHYSYMKPKYKDNLKLLYTDTDSFIYNIKCNNFYADMKTDSHLYDTSGYDLNNPYGIELLNAKQLNKFKDENNGKVMSEFVALCSKMYATKISGGGGVKKAKGVKTSVVQDRIVFEDYKNCLYRNKSLVFEQNAFSLKKQQMYTVRQKKVALSNKDDKRYLIPGSVDTLPLGHYMIDLYKESEKEMNS